MRRVHINQFGQDDKLNIIASLRSNKTYIREAGVLYFTMKCENPVRIVTSPFNLYCEQWQTAELTVIGHHTRAASGYMVPVSDLDSGLLQRSVH